MAIHLVHSTLTALFCTHLQCYLHASVHVDICVAELNIHRAIYNYVNCIILCIITFQGYIHTLNP